MPEDSCVSDERYMKMALNVALRGQGRTSPNPCVGCILVNDGKVIAQGWTQPSGVPHAEIHALHMAGAEAKGATAYVTLEPCSHHGKTPPCADALIAAGIARVVAGTQDISEKVGGKGLQALREAGVEVKTGVCEDKAKCLLSGFIQAENEGLPYLSLKLATTQDGKIATKSGESKWITNDQSRRYVHLLRSRNDAIITGIGTVLADNPLLDCRLEGLAQDSPVRVVMDSHLRIPETSKMVQSAHRVPVWVVTLAEQAASEKAAVLRSMGVKVIACERGHDGRIHLPLALNMLSSEGLFNCLVECGGMLGTSLLKEELVQRIYWFHAPVIIGSEGVSAIAEGLAVADIQHAPAFTTQKVQRFGNDVLSVLEKSG